jgi:hypothetical protein
LQFRDFACDVLQRSTQVLRYVRVPVPQQGHSAFGKPTGARFVTLRLAWLRVLAAIELNGEA